MNKKSPSVSNVLLSYRGPTLYAFPGRVLPPRIASYYISFDSRCEVGAPVMDVLGASTELRFTFPFQTPTVCVYVHATVSTPEGASQSHVTFRYDGFDDGVVVSGDIEVPDHFKQIHAIVSSMVGTLHFLGSIKDQSGFSKDVFNERVTHGLLMFDAMLEQSLTISRARPGASGSAGASYVKTLVQDELDVSMSFMVAIFLTWFDGEYVRLTNQPSLVVDILFQGLRTDELASHLHRTSEPISVRVRGTVDGRAVEKMLTIGEPPAPAPRQGSLLDTFKKSNVVVRCAIPCAFPTVKMCIAFVVLEDVSRSQLAYEFESFTTSEGSLIPGQLMDVVQYKDVLSAVCVQIVKTARFLSATTEDGAAFRAEFNECIGELARRCETMDRLLSNKEMFRDLNIEEDSSSMQGHIELIDFCTKFADNLMMPIAQAIWFIVKQMGSEWTRLTGGVHSFTAIGRVLDKYLFPLGVRTFLTRDHSKQVDVDVHSLPRNVHLPRPTEAGPSRGPAPVARRPLAQAPSAAEATAAAAAAAEAAAADLLREEAAALEKAAREAEKKRKKRAARKANASGSGPVAAEVVTAIEPIPEVGEDQAEHTPESQEPAHAEIDPMEAMRAELERLRVENARISREHEDSKLCPICLAVPKNRILTCGHAFCETCIGELRERNAMTCPTCRRPFTDRGVNPFFGARTRSVWGGAALRL